MVVCWAVLPVNRKQEQYKYIKYHNTLSWLPAMGYNYNVVLFLKLNFIYNKLKFMYNELKFTLYVHLQQP